MNTKGSLQLWKRPAIKVLMAAIAVLLVAGQNLPGWAAESSNTQGPPEVRFEGYLKAQGPGKWVVGDFNVVVDQQTIVIEKLGRAEVGAWLIVWANRDSTGSLHAELIYVDRPAGQKGPIVQVSGRLTKKQNPWWVVHDVLILITAETYIPVDPQEDWIIWVLAEQHGTDLYALMVEVIARTPREMPVEFEGELEYIGPTSWRVSNRQVDITPQTVIIGGPPAIGQDLEIRATVATDGTPVAEIVRIVPPGSEVALGAMVAAIEPDTGSGQVWDMIVFPSEPWSNPFAMQVHVNGNTLVDERRAVARPGQWADVIALPLDREKYQADRIRLEQPVPVTINGGLEWMSEGGNRVSNSQKPVTSAGEDGLSRGAVLPISQTNIDGSWYRIGGRPVWIPRSVSDLLDRQYMDDVSVEGLLLGNGVIWARKVHTLTPGIR